MSEKKNSIDKNIKTLNLDKSIDNNWSKVNLLKC